MRDPNRIDAYCEKLKEYWSRVPDWRLGQLLMNVMRGTPYYPDIWFAEDETIFNRMDEVFGNEEETSN